MMHMCNTLIPSEGMKDKKLIPANYLLLIMFILIVILILIIIIIIVIIIVVRLL